MIEIFNVTTHQYLFNSPQQFTSSIHRYISLLQVTATNHHYISPLQFTATPYIFNSSLQLTAHCFNLPLHFSVTIHRYTSPLHFIFTARCFNLPTRLAGIPAKILPGPGSRSRQNFICRDRDRCRDFMKFSLIFRKVFTNFS